MDDKSRPDARLRELALFAGAGGGILGGKLLGWRTVCAVELDAYAAAVLAQRQNDGCFEDFPVWSDIKTFDGRPWRGLVDVVSGGFPCQDISCAGKGAGITGERSGLWSEMARVVREVGPRYVFVENSPMLTSRGLGVVLGDMAEMGFDAKWGVLGAHHAGAPHKRDRIWIVAYRIGARLEIGELHSGVRAEAAGTQTGEAADGCGKNVADSSRIQQRRHEQRTERERIGAGGESINMGDSDVAPENTLTAPSGPRRAACQSSWWEFEPELGRVANGVSARVDRLKAIGNGQVPAVVKLAWRTLKGK